MLHTFLLHFFIAIISLICCKICRLYLSILKFGLRLDSFKFFRQTFVIVIPLLSFKEITYVYLLKIPIAHNKNWILWLNCTSARSAPQILSIKGESLFLFFMLCLTYFHFSSRFISKRGGTTISFFIKKMYRPLKQDPVDIHHFLDFQQYIVNLVFL